MLVKINNLLGAIDVDIPTIHESCWRDWYYYKFKPNQIVLRRDGRITYNLYTRYKTLPLDGKEYIKNLICTVDDMIERREKRTATLCAKLDQLVSNRARRRTYINVPEQW